MKFGLKLWSTNQDTLPQAEELIEEGVFQYIELTPIPGTKVDAFLSYDLPYVIHITTERHGVNIANNEIRVFNFETIQNCIEWADQLQASYMILHPGFGQIRDALNFLNDICDKRILIENMPKVGLSDESMVGYTPNQINRLMDNKFGFCLDFGHAIKAAVSLNKNYKQFIAEFLELKPKMFHISDGNSYNEKDEHLNIDEGDYDFEFLMGCAKKSKSKYITLECPRTDLDAFDEDFKNLDRLVRF